MQRTDVGFDDVDAADLKRDSVVAVAVIVSVALVAAVTVVGRNTAAAAAPPSSSLFPAKLLLMMLKVKAAFSLRLLRHQPSSHRHCEA